MAFKPKTFSPGNPITATDLNDLQSNIQSIYDDSQKLVNTSTLATQIQKVAVRTSGQTETVPGLVKDKVISKDFNYKVNFTINPVVVATIAEDLKEKENIELSVYANSATSCKVSVKTNDATRKELKVNIVAVSVEPIS